MTLIERSLTLLPESERLYLKAKDKAAGYVFTRANGEPIPVRQIESAFKLGLRLAEIKRPFSPHSIRHTACSWLALAGVPIQRIMAIAGHKNINSTLIYAHLSPSSLDTALEVLSEKPKLDNGLDTRQVLKAVN